MWNEWFAVAIALRFGFETAMQIEDCRLQQHAQPVTDTIGLSSSRHDRPRGHRFTPRGCTMLLQFQDALLLMLLAGTMGLIIGVGVPAGLRAWRQPRPAAAKTPHLAPYTAPHPAPVRQGAAAPATHRARTRSRAQPLLPQAADLLLVDDSAVARAKLRRLFERAGYSVQLACDGVEALALLQRGRYALMVTDLEMPKMDGVTLINTCLRQPQTARMPMLAVSGHENLRAKFNECRQICGVHRKPWVDDILLSHVAALVGTRWARAAALSA
jgi:CheY-like chemotaxis protein